MSFITDIFKGSASGILSGASDIIGKFVEDPTKKAELSEQLQTLITTQQTDLAKLAEARYEAELSDIQSARDREIKIATADKAPLINKITLPILAAFVTLGFFGLLAYMLKYDVPAANKSLLDIMLGSLGTAWLSIVAYYFGSSAGSKEKDATISKLAS